MLLLQWNEKWMQLFYKITMKVRKMARRRRNFLKICTFICHRRAFPSSKSKPPLKNLTPRKLKGPPWILKIQQPPLNLSNPKSSTPLHEGGGLIVEAMIPFFVLKSQRCLNLCKICPSRRVLDFQDLGGGFEKGGEKLKGGEYLVRAMTRSNFNKLRPVWKISLRSIW